MKEMISLSAVSYFVGVSDVINSCARNSKVAAHFDVFCKVDLKFFIDHVKCFSQLTVLCFIAFIDAPTNGIKFFFSAQKRANNLIKQIPEN